MNPELPPKIVKPPVPKIESPDDYSAAFENVEKPLQEINEAYISIKLEKNALESEGFLNFEILK